MNGGRNNKLTIGNGSIKILVLSQILPEWNHGKDLFSSCFCDFKGSCSLEIYDSVVEPLIHTNDICCYSKHFINLITKSDAKFLIGFSFGGVILQRLLNENLIHNKKLILISTPFIISSDLMLKLQAIVKLLECNREYDALDMLSNLTSSNVTETLSYSDVSKARLRLLLGLRLLISHGKKSSVLNTSIPILNLYGSESKLVSEQDMVTRHNVINNKIEGAGMRVMIDKRSVVSKIIKDFIIHENDLQ